MYCNITHNLYCGVYFFVQPPATSPCSAPDCSNSCYYDPSVGEFDYCSPPCRDKHLLPKEKKDLQDDLKAFECHVKQDVLPVSDKKPRNGSPVTGGQSGYQSAQASGGVQQSTSINQATSRSSGSGTITIKLLTVYSLQATNSHTKLLLPNSS